MVLCADTSREDEVGAASTTSGRGYPTIRAGDVFSALPAVAAAFSPRAIVVQSSKKLCELVSISLSTGIATAVYLHNVEVAEIGGVLIPDPALLYISNSEFTADRWRNLFGIDSSVIPPYLDAPRYRVSEPGGKVLMINPVLIKGINIALRMAAARPEVPFLIAESWSVPEAWRQLFQKRLPRSARIEWREPSEDVRDLLSDAKLLLMPSIWEEAYGRSVIEAQLSGIPVLASNRGNLPATVGEGGLIIDLAAGIEGWTQGLDRLWLDPDFYAKASAAARRNAEQVIADQPAKLDHFIALLRDHASRC